MARLFSLLALVGIVGVAFFAPPYGPRPAYAIDCDTYPNQVFAQTFLRIDPDDPNGLDGPNDNGIACEELPCPCDTEPVEEAIGDEAGPPSPAATTDSGASASAGNVTANASVSTTLPSPTTTPALLGTIAVVPPTTTPVPSGPGLITPPSTGSGGLK
jgi:hypothetical protein